MAITPKTLAKKLLATLDRDLPRLKRIDAYLQGNHDMPYMPPTADEEYKLLAKRSISNWMPLLVNTPTQALYVDGFRRGEREARTTPKPGRAGDVMAEWLHWQQSRLDARQVAVHRGALTFGHSFTLTEKVKGGRIKTKGLSALKTVALFEDPANDDTPYVGLTITRSASEDQLGKARMWDGTYEYTVFFDSLSEPEKLIVVGKKRHGATECPLTRFAAYVDLEGRTLGVIEPMIALQNRINQTVFDLLVTQTYASFKVRYATGMAPPLELDPETGDPKLDPVTGQPIPIPMDHNAKRFLFAEDADVKFGSLDESPLGGFIESIDMSIRHLAAVSQTPPHHLLGQIANLSAEALMAAETALQRKITEFQTSFGECWERVFRLAAELAEDMTSAEDFGGEVIWRDMESRSLAQAADGLAKLRETLEIPKKGLWRRVPGVTQTELQEWEDMADTEDPVRELSASIRRATPATVTDS